jgi:hypothetical protein
MPAELSDPQVTSALGEIYSDLARAGSERRAVLAASSAVADRLPLELICCEEFRVRGHGMHPWCWYWAGPYAVEARTAASNTTTWIVQWHNVDEPARPLIEDAMIRAGVVPRPNDRLHQAILDLLRDYPVVVGTVAGKMVDDPTRQITLHRVLSRSCDPLPVEAIAAAGFAVR